MKREVKSDRAEYKAMYYKKLKEQGLCTSCLEPAITDKSRCEKCRERGVESDRKARVKRRLGYEDNDKGEYKMTPEERALFHIRLNQVFLVSADYTHIDIIKV